MRHTSVDSAEREGIRPDSRFSERDLERVLPYTASLTDQLVQARLRNGAVPGCVAVIPVGEVRRLTVNEDTERRWSSRRAHHQVHIACFEAIRDRTRSFVEERCI